MAFVAVVAGCARADRVVFCSGCPGYLDVSVIGWRSLCQQLGILRWPDGIIFSWALVSSRLIASLLPGLSFKQESGEVSIWTVLLLVWCITCYRRAIIAIWVWKFLLLFLSVSSSGT